MQDQPYEDLPLREFWTSPPGRYAEDYFWYPPPRSAAREAIGRFPVPDVREAAGLIPAPCARQIRRRLTGIALPPLGTCAVILAAAVYGGMNGSLEPAAAVILGMFALALAAAFVLWARAEYRRLCADREWD